MLESHCVGTMKLDVFECAMFFLGLILDWTEQAGIPPANPAVDYDGFGSLLSSQQHDFHNHLASTPERPLTSISAGYLPINQRSTDEDGHPDLALIDSWIVAPNPELKEDETSAFLTERPSDESVMDALRYAGFNVNEDHFMRTSEVEGHPLVKPNQHLYKDHLTSSHRQGSVSFPIVELHNLIEDSSSSGKSPIASADLVQNIEATSGGNLIRNDLPVEYRLGEREDLMIQQIDSCSSKFARTLQRLHPKPNQIQFLYTRRHLKGLSLVLTKMQAKSSPATAFSWISHPNGSYVERERLIHSFTSLITCVTYDHQRILKNLQFEEAAIQSQNQALLEWLREEILNPSIGFPIMGDITGQKASQVLAEKQPMFGKLNSFLSHLFGLANPQPKPQTTSSILMNFWYFSNQTQMWKKFGIHSDLCSALKDEFKRNACVAQPGYLLNQYLN